MDRSQKMASRIYEQQNRALHKAFAALGRSYRDCRDDWLMLCSEICKRPVGSLGEMTLGERHELVRELSGRGARVFAPVVPKAVAGWKKGDPDAGFAFHHTQSKELRMAYSLWGELGYAPATLSGMVKRRYHVEHERFLAPGQCEALVNYLRHRLAQKGQSVRYYR